MQFLTLLTNEGLTYYVACSAGVFFERAICSRKRHVETSPPPPFLLSPSHLPQGLLFLLSPIFHCHKIKDGGYNNTNTNKVSPAQNTPALQATYYGEKPLASWTCYSIKHHPVVCWKNNLFRHTRGSKQAARGFPPLLEQLLAVGSFLFRGRGGVWGG